MNLFRTAAAVLLASAVSLGLVSPSVAATPPGHLDSVVAVNDVLTARGWTLGAYVGVNADGVRLLNHGLTVARTDVNHTYRVTGNHGFNFAFTVPAGTHMVCFEPNLGCTRVTALARATKAQMVAQAQLIDPGRTITWSWAALPTGTLGQAEPWSKKISISSVVPVVNLRSVLLHEWSHNLQYLAAGGDWWLAVTQANTAAGYSSSTSYYGLERQADCMALVMGATYQGYGCPATMINSAKRTIILATSSKGPTK